MSHLFFTKELEITHHYRGQEKKVRVLNICFKNNIGAAMPHPVTDFIRLYYQNKGLSLNSHKNASRDLYKSNQHR